MFTLTEEKKMENSLHRNLFSSKALSYSHPKGVCPEIHLIFFGGRSTHYFASYLSNRVFPCNICKLLACTP